MIIIDIPYIETNELKSRVINNITIDGKIHKIWFEVDNEYKDFLCVERDDAYLIGVLSFAMRNNHNILCKTPITDELLYKIETILIPSLCKYGKALHNISIEAETLAPIQSGFAVGTGCSCGVDSFSSIVNHNKSHYPNLDLTHLCINNVGAFNECYQSYGIDAVKDERYRITRNVAEEIGLPLIVTDSNFTEEIPMNHLLTHTYSSCFAVYILQKLWAKYYYSSSGIDYSGFSLEDNDIKDCAYYELLSLQCFSTSGLQIYSEGGEKDRLEKTRDIIGFRIAQEHLHVCIQRPYNCGNCSKCLRTLLSLDVLNSLDKFKDSFDVDEYLSNKQENLMWLIEEHLKGSTMIEPIYDGFVEKGQISNKLIHKTKKRLLKYKVLNFLSPVLGRMSVLYRKIVPKK